MLHFTAADSNCYSYKMLKMSKKQLPNNMFLLDLMKGQNAPVIAY